MLARKKKATFYLPEDLLRVTRVHAARTDRRDSQVVEEALRAYLGYGTEASPWATEVEPVPSGDDEPAAADVTATEPAPSQADHPPEPAEAEHPAPAEESFEPERPVEPPPPLDPEEALALAVSELHALRDEGAGGR